MTWLSGIIPCLKRDKCTCGYVSMKPRNLQLDTSGLKQVGNIDGSRVLELLQERWSVCMEARHGNVTRITAASVGGAVSH